MISARREFLEAFLGALGAAEIVTWCERETEVSGTLRWAEDSEVLDLTGDEGADMQDFAWRVREEAAPSVLTYRLADLLRRYQLVEIDRIRVSRAGLLAIWREDGDESLDATDVAAALDALGAISVALFEDGRETGETLVIRG